MLNLSTPIPTALRGKIRALVKAHKDWRLFLEANDIVSASARNADLIRFALFHPALTAQIEQMLLQASPEGAKHPEVLELQQPTLEEQVAEIERLMHAFFQRFPQRKPRIRVQAVTEDA